MLALRSIRRTAHHSCPQLVFHSSDNDLLADPKRPATLILGFGGAKPKHVEKYAALNHKLGLGCVSYTGRDFWDNVPAPDEGIVFAPLFTDPHHRDRPLIVHCTSMNGFRSLLKLYRWLDANGEATHRLRGVLFDSCPSFLTPYELAFGRSSTEDLPVLTFLPKATLSRAVMKSLSWANPAALSDRSMYHYVSRWLVLPRAQTFIFSETDAIVDFRWVEKFAEKQINKGNDVFVENFKTSPHVQHIRTDPERYENALKDLIKRSL